MLNLKKVIALVCVFAMVLTTVAFGATYTDVTEDSAYYEAVETLNKLEIVTGYEDGTYKPEDGVTRAEMAALIARIQGYGETAKANANTAFTDVPASHWASGYIANAAGMGIINGYGDGTFGPDDSVKYEQAVKMIMATLGYTPFAEKNGGYPTGYLAAAQRYDVSLAVANAAVGQDANRGTVAQLLANAIDTPLMVQSKWNTNGEVEYVIADGKSYDYKTLMSENLGYVKLRGIVTETPTAVLTGSKTIDTTAKAEVKIDVVDNFDTNNKDFQTLGYKTFLAGETDAAEYLGRSVIVYVKKVADDYEIVSVAVDTNRNEELTIALDQFAAYTANDCIKYYREGANDTTEAKLEPAASGNSFDVIFNGTAVTASTVFAGVTPYVTAGSLFGGAITLVDNDEVKGYDVAFVDVASTAVVKKVTEDGIYFYNGVEYADGNVSKEIEIDAEDETKVVVILKDGEEIEAAELAEWDVLSIYAVNDDSAVIVAEVVANEVVGTITSTKKSTTSDGDVAYKVGDAWYDVAAGAYDEGMAINEGGKFYIDAFGKIAAFVEDAALAGGAAANYGYVTGVSTEPAEFGGAGFDVKVQMVTADGVQVFTLKNNAKFVYFKDETDPTPDTIETITMDIQAWSDTNADDLPNDVSSPTVVQGATKWAKFDDIDDTVVKYTKNSAGQLSEVVMANGTSKFSTKSLGGSSLTFDAENSKFVAGTGTGGYVDEDAIVFIIGTDVADCKVGAVADFDDEEAYHIIASYADDKADDVNIVVADATSFLTSKSSSLAVVKEVGTGYNDDGEAVYTITYLVDGEEVTATTTGDAKANLDSQYSGNDQIASPTIPAAITPGDVVKVKVGADGLIANVKVVWDFAEDIRTASAASATFKADNLDAKEKFYGGVVTNFVEKSTEITAGGATIKLSKAANVYVVDNNGRSLVIKNGSDGNFKYFEALYGSDAVDVYFAGNATTTPDLNESAADNSTATTAKGYADHVYFRTYEDKPVDVIIVKGTDIKVKVD